MFGQRPFKLCRGLQRAAGKTGRAVKNLDALADGQLQGVLGFAGLGDFLHIEPHHRLAVRGHAGALIQNAQQLLFLGEYPGQWRGDGKRCTAGAGVVHVDPGLNQYILVTVTHGDVGFLVVTVKHDTGGIQ